MQTGSVQRENKKCKDRKSAGEVEKRRRKKDYYAA